MGRALVVGILTAILVSIASYVELGVVLGGLAFLVMAQQDTLRSRISKLEWIVATMRPPGTATTPVASSPASAGVPTPRPVSTFAVEYIRAIRARYSREAIDAALVASGHDAASIQLAWSAALGPVVPAGASTAAATAVPEASPGGSATATPRPSSPPSPRPPSAIEAWWEQIRSSSSGELEALVAGRLVPIIGGVALIAAAILFLGLAFSRGWIGEEGRVLIGVVVGVVGLLVGTVMLERGQPLIGHIVFGVGLGVFALALFAATQLYELIPPAMGVLAALVADLSAAVIAIRYRSQLIAGFGLVTILLAPPIMGATPDVMTLLFIGVALLSTTVVSIFQSWRWLPAVAFALTAPQLASYALGLPEPTQAVPVLIGFGVLNAAAATGEEWRVLRRELSPTSAGLLVASAGFVVWAVLTVLAGDAAALRGVLVLGIGLAHLALGVAFLLRGGDRHPFGLLTAGTGVTAASLAVPIALAGPAVPMIWAAEALALTWVAVKRRHLVSGLGAMALGLLAVGHLAFIEFSPRLGLLPGEDGIPFVDPAGIALIWTIGVGLAIAALLRTNSERSYVGAVLLGLVAWALPRETADVTLIWAWGLVAVIATAAAWQWIPADQASPALSVEAPPEAARYAARFAPVALWLVVAAVGAAAYVNTVIAFLPLNDIAALIGQTTSPPEVPFVDEGTTAALGLLITGLACGALGRAAWWRATSAIVAGSTVAYLLLFEIPLAWVVVGWCLVAVAMLLASERVVREPAVRVAAMVIGALAIVLYLTVVLPPWSALVATDADGHAPVVHDTTAAGLAIIGLLVLGARSWTAPRERLALGAAAGAAAVYLISVIVVDTVEWQAGSLSGVDLWYAGQVALSVCWAFLGLGILVAGLVTRRLAVRVFGLALLGLATLKVFIVDMSTLDIAFRVLSFVGLGLLLVGTGWIYLRLQGRAAPPEPGGPAS
jgi:uncharacterized membrane protein